MKAAVLEAVKNTNLKTSVLGRGISFDKAGGLTGAKRYVFHIVHGQYVLVGSGTHKRAIVPADF